MARNVVEDLRLRFEFGVQGSGYMVEGSRFVSGLEFGIDLGFGVQGRSSVQCAG